MSLPLPVPVPVPVRVWVRSRARVRAYVPKIHVHTHTYTILYACTGHCRQEQRQQPPTSAGIHVQVHPAIRDHDCSPWPHACGACRRCQDTLRQGTICMYALLYVCVCVCMRYDHAYDLLTNVAYIAVSFTLPLTLRSLPST
jgi:hypothetical protein